MLPPPAAGGIGADLRALEQQQAVVRPDLDSPAAPLRRLEELMAAPLRSSIASASTMTVPARPPPVLRAVIRPPLRSSRTPASTSIRPPSPELSALVVISPSSIRRRSADTISVPPLAGVEALRGDLAAVGDRDHRRRHGRRSRIACIRRGALGAGEDAARREVTGSGSTEPALSGDEDGLARVHNDIAAGAGARTPLPRCVALRCPIQSGRR